MNTEVHQATRECMELHCYWHDVDEPFLETSFEACMECCHVWQSEQELIEDDFKAQVIAGREIVGHEPVRKQFGREVDICPHCAHTF